MTDRAFEESDDAALVAEALRLEAAGKSQRQIAAALGKPRHWVRFTALPKTGPAIGAAPVAVDPRTPLEFHPLANLFPLIEDAEFDDLVADICANGQREDIVLLDGKVLDGRNRYRACRAASITPRAIVFHSEVHGEPLAFVISKNLKRRHLDESQRAMVAARLETYRHGDNQHSAADAKLHVRRDEAAKQMRVSPRSVASAAVVRDKAAPEVVRAVDRGKLTVSQRSPHLASHGRLSIARLRIIARALSIRPAAPSEDNRGHEPIDALPNQGDGYECSAICSR
jgi:hypothetical protein